MRTNHTTLRLLPDRLCKGVVTFILCCTSRVQPGILFPVAMHILDSVEIRHTHIQRRIRRPPARTAYGFVCFRSGSFPAPPASRGRWATGASSTVSPDTASGVPVVQMRKSSNVVGRPVVRQQPLIPRHHLRTSQSRYSQGQPTRKLCTASTVLSTAPSFADAPFTIPTPRRRPPSSYQLPPHCYVGQIEGQTDGIEEYLPCHTPTDATSADKTRERSIAGKPCTPHKQNNSRS